MPAQVVNVVLGNDDAASPLSLAKNSGAAIGDLLVALITGHSNTLASFTAPSGWTNQGSFTRSASQEGKVYSRVVDGTEPATIDFPYPGGADVAGAMFRISGADITTVTIGLQATGFATAAASMASPTITPADADDLLICAVSHSPSPGATQSATIPSGMTTQGGSQVAGGFQGIRVASEQLVSGAATGARTWTSYAPTGANDAVAWSITVKSVTTTPPVPIAFVPRAFRRQVGRLRTHSYVVMVPAAISLAGGPQIIAVTQAAEVETAQAIGKAKVKAVGQAVEVETAQAITPRKTRAVGQATETETSQALAKAKVKAVAQAAETEAAQTAGRVKTRAVAQAVEVETAQTIVVAGGQIGSAVETETAQPVGARKGAAVAPVSETETAQALTVRKTRATAQATETETAQPLAKAKVKAATQATETETAQAIARRKTLTVGQAVEVEQAQAIQPLGDKTIPVGAAVEVETAQPVAKSKRRAVGQAGETETAQAVAKRYAYAVGSALELEEAKTVAPTGGAAPPRWVEHTASSSSHIEGAADSGGHVEGVLVGSGIVENSGGI